MKLHPELPEFEVFDENLALYNYELFSKDSPSDVCFVEDVVNPTIEFLIETIKVLKLDFAHERFKREQLTIELQKYQEISNELRSQDSQS